MALDVKKIILCITIFFHAFMYHLFMVNSFHAALSSLSESVTVGGARASMIMVLCFSKISSLVAVFELVFTDGMQEARIKYLQWLRYS